MLGAILGDIIGSPFEFDQGDKTTEFKLFSSRSEFTDDTIMSIAVADALMNTTGNDDQLIKEKLIDAMQYWGKKYPYAGYGCRFNGWLHTKNPEPYNSFGNGSAMRVSSVGWLYDSLEETMHIAKLTAEVTHNHPEGIKGAVVTAGAIYLGRTGHSKEEIRKFAESLGYDLSRTCDEIRPTHFHNESCMDAIPVAFAAFFEGESVEEVIRLAVSLGGDTDTIAAIAGSIAEGYGYPVESNLEKQGLQYLSKDLLDVYHQFDQRRK